MDASWSALVARRIRDLWRHPWILVAFAIPHGLLAGIACGLTRGDSVVFYVGFVAMVAFVLLSASTAISSWWLDYCQPWPGSGAGLAFGHLAAVWALGLPALLVGLPFALGLAVSAGRPLLPVAGAFLLLVLLLASWHPWQALFSVSSSATQPMPGPALAIMFVPAILGLVAFADSRGAPDVPLVAQLTGFLALRDLLAPASTGEVASLFGLPVGSFWQLLAVLVPFGAAGFLALSWALSAPRAVFLPKPWALGLLALLAILTLGTSWDLAPTPGAIIGRMVVLAMLGGLLAVLSTPGRPDVLVGLLAAQGRGKRWLPFLADRADGRIQATLVALVAGLAAAAASPSSGEAAWRGAAEVVLAVLAIGWASQIRRLFKPGAIRAVILLAEVAGWLVLGGFWFVSHHPRGFPVWLWPTVITVLDLALIVTLGLRLERLRSALSSATRPDRAATRGATSRAQAALLDFNPVAALLAWPRLNHFAWLPGLLVVAAFASIALGWARASTSGGPYQMFGMVEWIWVIFVPLLALPRSSNLQTQADELRLSAASDQAVLGALAGRFLVTLPGLAVLAPAGVLLAMLSGKGAWVGVVDQALILLLFLVLQPLLGAGRGTGANPIGLGIMLLTLASLLSFLGTSRHAATLLDPGLGRWAGTGEHLWGFAVGRPTLVALNDSVFAALGIWAAMACAGPWAGPARPLSALLAGAVVLLFNGAAWGDPRPTATVAVLLATLGLGVAAIAACTAGWRPI